MIVSLNEAQGMATKAAVGAGRPWGLAQEAGRAMAALEAMRLPGAASLLGLLTDTDGVPCDALRPASVNERILQGEGPMCPVLVGAYFEDTAGEAQATGKLHNVYYPLLLLPFVRMLWDVVQLEWQNTTVIFDFREASVQGTELTAAIGETVLITPAEPSLLAASNPAHLYQLGPVDIADEIWEALSGFAHRTYVPATEASRLKGAGAGLTDND